LRSYFSFFTVLTNILVAVTLTTSLRPTRTHAMEFFARPNVQTGIAASIALVGAIYVLLLRNVWNPQGLQLVANILLHYTMPVLFVVFWWITVPARDVSRSNIWLWMLYPIVYFLLAMARGVTSGVYPYPFIDAGQIGFARAFGNAFAILLGFISMSLFFVAVGRRKGTGIAAFPAPR
jgi:hypothetical protein